MLAGGKNALYVLLVLLETACFIMVITAHSYLSLVVLPALVLLVLRKRQVLYISTLASSFVLTALINNVYAYVVSILVALVGSSYYILSCREENEVKGIRVMLLMYMPLYVISPRTVAPAMASLLAYLIHLLREYLRLSKSRVYLFTLNPTVHLNENADVVLEVKCPGRFKYKVQVDDNTYLVRESTDSALDVIRVKATRLGVTRHVVKVVLTDSRELAKVAHGPYVLEYVTIPKFSEFIKQVERVLRRYAEYIAVPLISIVTLQRGLGKGLKGVSGEGEAPVTGKGVHTIPATITSNKGHSMIAGGIELPENVIGGQHAGMASMRLEAPPSVQKYFEVKIAWKTPRKMLERIIQMIKAYVGEYLGVREYQPGDSLRMVHWKKSFRRDEMLDLAVKVYSSSEVDKQSGGERLIILADLTATSPEELDLLLQTLYSQLLSIIKSTDRALSELHLYLVTPRDETYFLKGKVIDILSALNALILEEKYTSLHNYSSWPRKNPPVKGEVAGFLEQLVEYYRSYGHALVKDLNSWGLEKGNVVIIYSKALSFKYYVVATVLKEHGFAVTTSGTHAV